jgi:hypothetical protein
MNSLLRFILKPGVIACLLLFAEILFAQEPDSDHITIARKVISERREVILKFAMPDDVTLETLTTTLSIHHLNNDTITAYANEAEFDEFLSFNIPFEIITPPSLKHSAVSKLKNSAMDWRNNYPAYSTYIDLMNEFSDHYPYLCRLYEFGQSINGKKLLALKITDSPDLIEQEPVVFLSSTMHGDEPLGYILMLRLIDHLLGNYNTNEDIHHLIDNTVIYINPLANPDGAYFLSDTSLDGATRYNAGEKDLNRDFPSLNDENWESRSRQPETIAMMNFMKDLNITLAANFHGGAELVNYPWDTWNRLHADDAWYRHISRAFVDTIHAYGPSNYMTDFDDGITNGYAWYVVYGGRQDYTNYFLHGREVTIELSAESMPPENTIENYWNYTKRSLIQFIGQALTGIHGTVTDTYSGMPVRAAVSIAGHDADHSFVYASESNGSYFRLIHAGDYVLSFSAFCYIQNNISVRADQDKATMLNAECIPLMNDECTPLNSGPYLLFPNPFSNILYANCAEQCNEIHIEIFDMTGSRIFTDKLAGVFEGIQALQIPDLGSGVYIFKVTFGSRQIRHIIIKGSR